MSNSSKLCASELLIVVFRYDENNDLKTVGCRADPMRTVNDKLITADAKTEELVGLSQCRKRNFQTDDENATKRQRETKDVEREKLPGEAKGWTKPRVHTPSAINSYRPDHCYARVRYLPLESATTNVPNLSNNRHLTTDLNCHESRASSASFESLACLPRPCPVTAFQSTVKLTTDEIRPQHVDPSRHVVAGTDVSHGVIDVPIVRPSSVTQIPPFQSKSVSDNGLYALVTEPDQSKETIALKQVEIDLRFRPERIENKGRQSGGEIESVTPPNYVNRGVGNGTQRYQGLRTIDVTRCSNETEKAPAEDPDVCLQHRCTVRSETVRAASAEQRVYKAQAGKKTGKKRPKRDRRRKRHGRARRHRDTLKNPERSREPGSLAIEEQPALSDALCMSRKEQKAVKEVNHTETVSSVSSQAATTCRHSNGLCDPSYSLSSSSGRLNSGDLSCPFKLNDIVWANMVDKPWWPAQVQSFVSIGDGDSSRHPIQCVAVRWFGFKKVMSQSVVPSSLLASFIPSYGDHYLPEKKTTTYVRAVREAVEILGMDPDDPMLGNQREDHCARAENAVA